MILPEPKINPQSEITPEEAKSRLSQGSWSEKDAAALKLVCQDTDRSERCQNTKSWILSWEQSRFLYESNFVPRYWPGTQIEAASIPFFTVATAVNAVSPQVMSGLFYENPPFITQERPGTTAQAARAVSALLGYQLEDIEFRTELALGIENCLLFGTSMFQWGWEKFTKERKIIKRKTPATVVPSTVPGAPPTRLSNGELEEEIIEEVVDRPTFEHIENLKEVMVDPGLRVPDIRKAKYVVRRRYMTYDDLDKLRDREGYDIPSREVLLSLFMPPQEPVESNISEESSRNPLWDGRAEPRWEETTSDPFQKPLEVLERWDNDTYIVVLQKKLVIFNGKNIYGKIPFLSVGWWRIPGGFWGLGYGRTIGSDQRLQTGMTQLLIDVCNLMLNTPLVRVRGKSIPTQNIRIGPGKIIEVDAQGDLEPLARPAAVPEAGQLLAMSQGRVDTVSGANPISSMGQAGASGHSNLARSSAGAQLLGSGANNPIAEFVERISVQVIVPLLYEFQEMDRGMLPESQLEFILSDELKHVYLDEEGKPGDLVDILNARVKFDILAGSQMQVRRQMTQALPLITQFLASPSLLEQLSIEGKKVNVDELIRTWGEMAQMKNMKDMIIPMTQEDLQRRQQSSQGGLAQQKFQQQQALLAQKAAQQEQLQDADNVAQAARHSLRVAFEKSVEPEELSGNPNTQSTGWGSAA